MHAALESAVEIELAGQVLWLLPDRAVYWPARSRLLIADLHLGKGDTFRLAGVSVPSGGTRHDLARLAALIDSTGARECWVLGDLVHGQVATGAWRAQSRAFVASFPGVRFAVVPGNHDRQVQDGAQGFAVVEDRVEDGGIALLHAPPTSIAQPSLSGHLHPVLKLAGERRAWPVFWQRGQRLVLPAFSAFTGGFRVEPETGDHLHLCNGQALVSLDLSARN